MFFFAFSINYTLLTSFIVFDNLSLPSNTFTKSEVVNRACILILHNLKLFLMLNFPISTLILYIIANTTFIDREIRQAKAANHSRNDKFSFDANCCAITLKLMDYAIQV